MSEFCNQQGEGVSLDPSSHVSFCELEHVVVGAHCVLRHCVIRGLPGRPVIIESGTELIQCLVENTGQSRSFAFGNWSMTASDTVVGAGSRFAQSHLEDAWIGKKVVGHRCVVRASRVGDGCELRAHSNLILTCAAAHCNLGSEISKCMLEGEGFVSEHTSSYLSLVAPMYYPLLRASGEETLSPALPNLTNIGAGTVFANYSGRPMPASELKQSSGSLKGTSIVFGAFTAVNSVIVNRYDQPEATDDIFTILRHRDVTVLGFACFVEKKVTGRIPAFSYAASPSTPSIKIGWVLDRQPGIILNILAKMKKRLGSRAGALQDLVEDTIRLEIRLLEEQQQNPNTRFAPEQIERGIQTYQKHMDGRWGILATGELVATWGFDTRSQQWIPQ